ncbi:MAG: hypothetical protein OHK0023_01430 [Anaerolineae bacterium]
MNIGILGAGTVGQMLAAKLSESGYPVMIGTRDVPTLLARIEADGFSNPP